MDAYADATASVLLYRASLTFADDVFAEERQILQGSMAFVRQVNRRNFQNI